MVCYVLIFFYFYVYYKNIYGLFLGGFSYELKFLEELFLA